MAARVTKTCSKCGIRKKFDRFWRATKKSADGFEAQCIDCRVSKRKPLSELAKANAKARSRDKILAKYGLTREQYDSLWLSQNGLCAICSYMDSDDQRSLAIDHDHRTGIVRGLLCGRCNTTLGFMEDSVLMLANAQLYLERNNVWSSATSKQVTEIILASRRES